MKENITVALVISTYNSPAYLSLCLRSVAAQTVMPDEVIIADDGSTKETKTVIDRFKNEIESRFPEKIRVKHVWHPDEGFRKTIILNKAIAASSGDYIIQLDGDLLVHPRFISDHIRAARPGAYVMGCRVMLKPEKTRLLLDSGKAPGSVSGRGCAHRVNGIRLPFLSPFFRSLRRHDVFFARGGLMGCWRKDFFAVNGYDEHLTGWGYEDNELAARLRNAGVEADLLKFAALSYHLYHKESPRDRAGSNREAFLETLRQGIVRCADGVNKYLPE